MGCSLASQLTTPLKMIVCRCFQMFKIIHTVVDDEEAVSMVSTID